jgi:hypothetical protein
MGESGDTIGGCLRVLGALAVLLGALTIWLLIMMVPENTIYLHGQLHWSAATRVVVVLLLASLAVVSTPAGQRRFSAGLFYTWAVANIIMRMGHEIGLHAAWQRWLVGLGLASPFLYLLLTVSPEWKKWQEWRHGNKPR